MEKSTHLELYVWVRPSVCVCGVLCEHGQVCVCMNPFVQRVTYRYVCSHMSTEDGVYGGVCVMCRFTSMRVEYVHVFTVSGRHSTRVFRCPCVWTCSVTCAYGGHEIIGLGSPFFSTVVSTAHGWLLAGSGSS